MRPDQDEALRCRQRRSDRAALLDQLDDRSDAKRAGLRLQKGLRDVVVKVVGRQPVDDLLGLKIRQVRSEYRLARAGDQGRQQRRHHQRPEKRKQEPQAERG